MSTPADAHPLDPLSQALGRLEGRLDAFEKHVMDRFAQIDQRFDRLERRITGLYALLTIGLTIIGWLVTRR